MSGNGQKTKQFGVRTVIIVGAIIVVGTAALFGTALYRGTVTVPPETVTQIWVGVGTLLTGAFLAAASYLQVRMLRISGEAAELRAARILEDAAQQAEMSRARSDRNAFETQSQLGEVLHEVKNGIPDKTAAIVKENAEQMATVVEGQRMAAQIAANSEKIQAMLDAAAARDAKLDALLMAQAVPASLPDVATGALALKVDQILVGQAEAAAAVADTTLTQIETNTAKTVEAIRENAGRDEPEGSAV